MFDEIARRVSSTPQPVDRERRDRAAASVFAAAAAVVASAEALVKQEQVDAAEVAAAAAWAAMPFDTGGIFEAEQAVVWLELKAEHCRLAQRAVTAATLAARALSRGLSDDEFSRSDLMADAIATLVAARRVVRENNVTHIAFDRWSSIEDSSEDDAA